MSLIPPRKEKIFFNATSTDNSKARFRIYWTYQSTFYIHSYWPLNKKAQDMEDLYYECKKEAGLR